MNPEITKTDAKSGSVSMCQALVHKDYLGATWICMAAALFNQMSGINIVNTYSTTILESCRDNGMDLVISISTCNYMIGFAGFLGASLAILALRFTFRTIFIGGHLFMGIFLGGAYAFL